MADRSAAAPSASDLSVVVPMHRTAAHLPELLRRLDGAVPGAEVVLVDDACPQRSADLALALPAGSLRLVVVRVSPNIGQHAAVHVGTRHASGEVVALMDADLQDAPESVPLLLDHLVAHPDADACCAARRGRYTSTGRRCTAAAYRLSARALSLGRIPADAGMFMVVRRGAVERLRGLDDPFVPLVPGLAATGARLLALPVVREARTDGSSAHTGRARLRIALRGLVVLTPLRGMLAARHRRRWAALAPTVAVQLPHPTGQRDE